MSAFPSLTFAPDPVGNRAQLAEKLKLSDPLVVDRRRDRDLEPDWLVQLRRRLKELAVSGVGAGMVVRPLFLSPFPWNRALTLASPRSHGGP